MLSAIVGGGIVGIPFAMIHTGIPLGLFLNVGVATMGTYTGMLYLRCKDLSPTYVESLYELGFVCMGKFAIYVIAGAIFISGIGCIMIYLIVFGDVSASLAKQALTSDEESIMTTRAIYVLAISILMTPLCLKKMLSEMKIVSILLFVSIGIFIIVFIIQLASGTNENHDETYGQYYKVDFNMALVTGLNIIVLAYSYQINLFPTYNSLGAIKSNETGLNAVMIGTGLSFLIYSTLGVLAIYIFGSSLDPSVLTNVDEETNVYSIVIRVTFLVVLGCHIPYMFFPTKESFLIIVDEAQKGSMAKELEYKI